MEGLNLFLPAFTEVIGEVLLQRLTTVELGHSDGSNDRMVGQLADLILHGGEIEISHQLAIAGLINDSLKKQLTKPVFSAMVCDFFVPSELGSKGDRHDFENGQIPNLKGVP